MKHHIKLITLLFLVCACSSQQKRARTTQYNYVDAITTVQTVSFKSKVPLDCLSSTLQREAGNQPSHGVYAVGVTIMTRAKGNIHNICRVTRARRQFEGVRKNGFVKVSRKILGIAKSVLASRETGWTHFWAPKTQAQLRRRKPTWATAYEKRQCKKQQIADHVFFNNQQCRHSRSSLLNAQND